MARHLLGRPRRTEVASGIAGSAVARQQGPQDALNEILNSPGLINPDVTIDSVTSRSSVGNDFDITKAPIPSTSFAAPKTFVKNVDNDKTNTAIDIQEAIDRIKGQGTGNPAVDSQDYLLKTAFSRRQEDFFNGLSEVQAQISGQYQDRIGALQDELAGYKGGLVDVNKAYGEYADDANAILEQAASVEADPLPDSAVVAEVGENFDKFGGVMSEMLQRIDGSGNKELAKAMAGEVRYMEETISDGLQSGLQSQSELHRLAGAEAQAIANMAWKDDAFNAERSRYQLELEIGQQIQNKQDQIAEARTQMDQALADARSKWGDFSMTPDELWDAGMVDYFNSQGLNDIEQQEMRDVWKQIIGNNPQAGVNFDTFKGSLMQMINENNLATIGVLDDYDRIVGSLTSQFEAGNESAGVALARIMNSMTQSVTLASLRGLAEIGSQFGIGLGDMSENIKPDNIDWDALDNITGTKFQSMLNLWEHQKDFKANYDDYLKTQATNVPRGGSSQAPNNYQNRFQTDYTYRREQTVPYFSKRIEQVFPGTEFGGVHFTDSSRRTVARGMMRPPDQVSSTKAKNSDHQSGGAMDVYWKNSDGSPNGQQLAKINQWLKNQPGVSFTNYKDGKSHVHVSFQIGYKVPGA